MPDGLALALQTPGLGWLAAVTFLAGGVYGFAGFGAALIFMPLATLLISPVAAVAVLSVTALGSALTVLPDAWRDADRRATLTMLAFAFAFTPVGLWCLGVLDREVIRWAVSVVVFITLAALITGWRFRTQPGWRAWVGVGSGVGFVGGATGLNGPVLVLFQLAGPDSVARTRANTIVVLTVSSLGFLPFMAGLGLLPMEAAWLGILLTPVYAAGTWAGREVFDPARAVLYRRVAYGIVAGAGLLGLPLFD